MCEKVVEVEHALEDVKELLSGQHTTAHSSPSDDIDWKDEWIRIVQDVVEKDAGWKWVFPYLFCPIFLRLCPLAG